MLFEPIFSALGEADVRYVVVGGVAVVLHGCPRLTADLDLAIDLSIGQPDQAIRSLAALGLVPRLSVDINDFADPSVRRAWIEERNLTVFSLWDPADPLLQVDVFAEDPIPFEDLWRRAKPVRLNGRTIHIAAIEDLDTMKLAATQDWGWDHHRAEQRRTWSQATPEQLLRWLEEALRFAHEAGALGHPSVG